MAGTKTSGRRSMTDPKIQQFKGIAWDLIIKRVTSKNEEEREMWIDKYIGMFANRLIPQEMEGTPQVVVVQLPSEKYAAIINRESSRIIRGSVVSDSDGSEEPVSELCGASGREIPGELVSRDIVSDPAGSVPANTEG